MTHAPRSEPARRALWLARAALVVTVLAVIPGLDEMFELPKVAALRVSGLACLACAVASGWPRRNALGLADTVAWIWLAVEALATAFSVAPLRSVSGVALQREGLVTSCALIGIFVAARAAAREALVTLDLACAAIGIASVLAILQWAGADPFAWANTAVYSGRMRPFATLGHPNTLGVVTAAAAVASAALIARETPRNALRIGVAAVAAIATVLTLSRAAWLGSAAGLLTVAIVRARGQRVTRRAWMIAAGTAAAAFALTFATGAGHAVWTRLAELARPASGSVGSRLEIWRSALAMGAARPLTGWGPATFDLVFPSVQTAAYWRTEWGGLPEHAHSILLHALATRGALGVIAGVAWLAPLALALRAAGSAREGRDARGPDARLVPALAGAIVAIGVSGGFGAIGIAGATLLAAACGMLVGLGGAVPAAAGGARVTGRTTAIPARAALAVGALAAIVSAVDIQASRFAHEARTDLATAPDLAPAPARAALALRPWDDAMARLVADAAFVAAHGDITRLGEAEAAARRAVALSPRSAMNHEQLAGVLAERAQAGDPVARREADAEFSRALDLAPRSAFIMMEAARYASLTGRQRDAIAMAERASALYPAEALPHSIVAAAAIAAGDSVRALAEARAALPLEWRGRGDTKAAVARLAASLGGGR
ncbi:MAG: O-antigen ligase family protein [Candidatus Eisenbacteria bacterium]|nr:O-antigen ligase family protein [Candidatus Eisenbacteria bacterium]